MVKPISDHHSIRYYLSSQLHVQQAVTLLEEAVPLQGSVHVIMDGKEITVTVAFQFLVVVSHFDCLVLKYRGH